MARLDCNIFPMLTENTIAKLQSQKIFTVYDFMLHSSDELNKKAGLTFKEVETLRGFFYKQFGGETINPNDLLGRQLKAAISTGIRNLDALLEGGLNHGKIYEICGFSSSGKSQLCHWISTYATLQANGTEVFYIDASSNFHICRIQMFLESMQCSDTAIASVMSNIKIYKIFKINDLFTIFHRLSKSADESQLSKKIVIVDSLSVLCALISNTELNPILSNFASVCRYLVNHCRAVVVIVNTVRFEHSGRLLTEEDKNINVNIRPSLGNYWLGIPNVRLLITSLENKRREVSVWNSCQLENGKNCLIDIKDEGIL